MIGFFLKKTFFDGWDNLFALVLMNVVFVVILAVGVLLPQALDAPWPVSLAVAILTAVAGSVWWSACVFALRQVADFGSVRIGDMPNALKEGLVPALQIGTVLALAILFLRVGLPFYLSRGALVGTLAAGLLFWCALILLLSIQYYLPLRARFGGGFRKNFRKCLVLFFDNAFFSVFLFLYNLVSIILSLFLAFLLPGLAGTALALDVALRLRLRKYDWLERNPGVARRSIPWEALLAEDRELVGKRTLKGMIFPWKE